MNIGGGGNTKQAREKIVRFVDLHTEILVKFNSIEFQLVPKMEPQNGFAY